MNCKGTVVLVGLGLVLSAGTSPATPLFDHVSSSTVDRIEAQLADITEPPAAPGTPLGDVRNCTNPQYDPECSTDPFMWYYCITDPQSGNPECITDPVMNPYCSTDPFWGNPDCIDWTNPDMYPECSTDPFMWYWCVTDPQSGNPDCVTDPVLNPYCSTDPFWGNPNCFVGVEDLPVNFALRAYPNPFNPSTTISFVMPETGEARLAVHSLTGQEVALLVEGLVARGESSVQFDAGHLASGVYVCVLETRDQVSSQKMLLIK